MGNLAQWLCHEAASRQTEQLEQEPLEGGLVCLGTGGNRGLELRE